MGITDDIMHKCGQEHENIPQGYRTDVYTSAAVSSNWTLKCEMQDCNAQCEQ